ncbi:hypothetical protein BGX24_007478 [Mortierella sp. AD032]|nr:hypothetical protein BGX24_007478 [Mortierella sp. AD032]
MKDNTLEDVNAAFSEFKEERYTRVQAQYEASKMDSRLIYGYNLWGLFSLCRTQTALWVTWWLVAASAIETTVSNGELLQGSSHIN